MDLSTWRNSVEEISTDRKKNTELKYSNFTGDVLNDTINFIVTFSHIFFFISLICKKIGKKNLKNLKKC